MIFVGGVAQAESGTDAPVTPATTIHGAPGNTPGFGGSSANPQGGGVNGGNGIHNIAGIQANAGTLDWPANTAHGGLDDWLDEVWAAALDGNQDAQDLLILMFIE